MSTFVKTDQAPQPIGPYSQAIITGNLVFTSGQIGMDPVSMKLADTFSEQAQQIFKNVTAILEEAGSHFSHIVKLTVYLTDMENYKEFNQIMMDCFQPPYPARTALGVSKLPARALIEVDVVAALITKLNNNI